jgi:hypothetical protein
MDSSVIDRPLTLRQLSARSWLGLTLLAAAFLYVWLLPLLRPRGDFLGGYYRLKDIFLGIPVGLGMLCAIAVLLVSARYRRAVAFRLIPLCISTIAVLFACDLGYTFGVLGVWRGNYWLDQAFIPRKYSAADDELGFVRKPGVSWQGYIPAANRLVNYRTDENGFRNAAGVGRADVVFIGDSYTEAAQVSQEDTFVRRVAAVSGLSVVNLGLGAYGPQQELIVLQRYGLAYHPRVVVWQLFEGNDLKDAMNFAQWRKNPQRVRTSIKERYLSSSLLTEWLSKTRQTQTDVPTVKLRLSDGTVRQIRLRYEYEPDEPTKFPQSLAETTHAIELGYRFCQSKGIQLVVVFVPTMVRVMEPYITFERAEDRERYLPKSLVNDKSDFSGRMAEFCGKLGCPFIDTFTALRHAAATDNRSLYIPNDEHLDIRGHEVVAQTVLEWLRSQAIVTQRPE